MTLGKVSNQVGTFFCLNAQTIQRGYGSDGSNAANIKDALEVGVNFFDSAHAYDNAGEFRTAFEGVNISQIVFSSKIPSYTLDGNDLGKSTRDCFECIRTSLGVEKLDILYLHGPDCIHKEVLDTLVNLTEEGSLSYIGLCNVEKDVIERLIKSDYPIAVIQNETNPLYWDKEVIDFCREHKIPMVGYRPFGKNQCGEIFDTETLKKIAARVRSSVQEVILQWLNQKGITPIAYSNSKEHIQSNMSIPTWELTREELLEIDALNTHTQLCNWQQFTNQEFLAHSKAWVATLDV